MVFVMRKLADVSDVCLILSRTRDNVKECEHFNLKEVAIIKYICLSYLFFVCKICWLSECELNRLKATHCRFLRRILNIPPSFVSRLSNAEIYNRVGMCPAGSCCWSGNYSCMDE